MQIGSWSFEIYIAEIPQREIGGNLEENKNNGCGYICVKQLQRYMGEWLLNSHQFECFHLQSGLL